MSDKSSLFALMDSHLSKTRLNEISIVNHENEPGRSASDVLLPAPPGPKLEIPNFFPGNSPMKDFLAKQILNTLNAKEKLKQEKEEQLKVEEELNRLKMEEKQQHIAKKLAEIKLQHEQEYVIDLTPAIIQQPKQKQKNVQPTTPKETLRKDERSKPGKVQNISDGDLWWDEEICLFKPRNPNLICTTDISYILKQKVKHGKCSSFGKVLCSRLWPIRKTYIPYETKKIESNIVLFDFKTKSPGDIYTENQRKPKMSTRWTVDIMDYI